MPPVVEPSCIATRPVIGMALRSNVSDEITCLNNRIRHRYRIFASSNGHRSAEVLITKIP